MQVFLTTCAVLGSLIYLVVRFFRTAQRKKQSGCEKCGMKQIGS